MKDNETFVSQPENSTNASLNDPEGRATITNDDPLPSITIGDVSVTEGNAGVVDAVLPSYIINGQR